MSAARKDLAQRYCQKHAVAEADFARAVLLATLHAPYRWIAPLLLAWSPERFAVDLELINCCGQLKRRRDLEAELAEYVFDERNRGFWRRTLRQRISTRRLRRLFKSAKPPLGTLRTEGSSGRS